MILLQLCSELVAVRRINDWSTTRGGPMLAMKLRYYVYLMVCVAVLVMLVFNPRLMAASGIPAACASLVELARQLLAAVR